MTATGVEWRPRVRVRGRRRARSLRNRWNSSSSPDRVEPLSETLIEATLHQAERTAGMPNVVSIEVASPGRFEDDSGDVVVVAENGAWRRESSEG